jgi:hypothetical protein
MASLIRAASERAVVDAPRAYAVPAPTPSAPAAAAPSGSAASENKTLKFVLSSLRARFKTSQGKLREIFREWDTDKSGSVDADEMRVALHGMGFTAVQPDDAAELIGAIDLGGDGEVQFEDFVRLLCPPKGETHAVTCSAADVARINVPVAPSVANMPGKVLMLGGRAVKRVLGPSDAASLRHTTVGDAGNGVGSDPLRESVMAGVDAAETAVRRAFSVGLGSAREGHDTVAAVVAEELGGAAAALAASGSGSPRPLAPRRATARREESVVLASLPPAEQHRILTARGLLPPEPPRPARPDVTPSWHAAGAKEEPSMEELIAAAHATNEAGRVFAEKVARGEAAMEEEPHEGGGLHRGFLSLAGHSGDLPPLPEKVSVPFSPLHLTARISARRAVPVPLLALPGVSRGALSPSATTDWGHPLSYMAQTGRPGGGGAAPQLLRAIVPAAVRPAPSETALMSGRTLTSEGSGEGGDLVTQLVPPPGSLDRSLHASSRLPPRREGLEGPFSSLGGEPAAAGPEGGASDTVVVGNIGGHASRAITAASRDALTPLDTGPFYTSAAARLVEGHVTRLRLSARDVLALPLAGKPTVPHFTAPAGEQGPLSPLRVPGGGESPREARFAERRRAFIATRGGEEDDVGGSGGGGGGRGGTASESTTLSALISGGRDLRASRFSSMLTGGGGGGGAAPGSIVPAPQEKEFNPTAHAAHQVPGGSRLLAAQVREEGARTTWLLSPPPSLHSEATPEHPSWHFASSARIAQTRTVIPEQEFARIARREKHAGQRAMFVALGAATAE